MQIDVRASEPFLCEHVHASGLPAGWDCPAPPNTTAQPRASEFRLSNTLGSHMVLQRDSKACVWGFADAGDTITLQMRAEYFTAITDDAGIWRIFVPPQPATMQPQTLLFSSASGAIASLTDVLFGDVFLAGG